MSYKKYILEKYMQIHISQEKEELEKLKNIIDDITTEKNSIEIHNSILRHQNIKLTKSNKQLQDKINNFYVNWEIIEEVNFDNWIYDNTQNQNVKENMKENMKRKISDITYDSDETETDDEIHIVKKPYINFNIW